MEFIAEISAKFNFYRKQIKCAVSVTYRLLIISFTGWTDENSRPDDGSHDDINPANQANLGLQLHFFIRHRGGRRRRMRVPDFRLIRLQHHIPLPSFHGDILPVSRHILFKAEFFRKSNQNHARQKSNVKHACRKNVPKKR